MAISGSDIKFKFATTTGPGDSTAGTANGSLGEFISTTELTDATLHNLFDVVGGDENLASESEYRCLFIHNTNATDTFLNVKAFISAEVAGGASVEIGVDPTAASAVDSASDQAVEIADEDTAPAGVSFSAPTDYDSGIDIGDLAPGEVRAIWIKRTTSNSAAKSNDGATIRIQGESL